jgi:hypothetical protein
VWQGTACARPYAEHFKQHVFLATGICASRMRTNARSQIRTVPESGAQRVGQCPANGGHYPCGATFVEAVH